MTSFITLALASLSLVTAPAADPKAAPGGGARADQEATQPSPQRRYCVQYEITGSRIRHRTCKTYAEWMKDGFDPTAKS